MPRSWRIWLLVVPLPFLGWFAAAWYFAPTPVLLWEVPRKQTPTLLGMLDETTLLVAFEREEPDTLWKYDVRTGRELGSVTLPTQELGSASRHSSDIVLTPDRTGLLIATYNVAGDPGGSQIVLCDARSLAVVRRYRCQEWTPALTSPEQRQGTLIALAVNGKILAWDARTGRARGAVPIQGPFRGRSAAQARLSPDGRLVAVIHSDPTPLRVVDLDDDLLVSIDGWFWVHHWDADGAGLSVIETVNRFNPSFRHFRLDSGRLTEDRPARLTGGLFEEALVAGNRILLTTTPDPPAWQRFLLERCGKTVRDWVNGWLPDRYTTMVLDAESGNAVAVGPPSFHLAARRIVMPDDETVVYVSAHTDTIRSYRLGLIRPWASPGGIAAGVVLSLMLLWATRRRQGSLTSPSPAAPAGRSH